MINLGIVRPGSTIYIPFETFASSTGAPITMTGLAVGDILVYKNGDVNQRTSTSGFTLLHTDGIDFDSLTGIHGVSINLADNTDTGFWVAGAKYFVVIGDITVDSQTMRFLAAMFEIGLPDSVQSTTIATVTSQTVFTLTAGSAEDQTYTGGMIVIFDAASAVQMAMKGIVDYVGSTKQISLESASVFTIAAGDSVCILPPVSVGGFLGFTPAMSVAATGTLKTDITHAAGTAWATDIASKLQTALGTNGSNVLAELSQAAPSATPSLGAALMLLYMALRNLHTATAATESITNDAGTVICKATLTDDLTTFSKSELVSGP